MLVVNYVYLVSNDKRLVAFRDLPPLGAVLLIQKQILLLLFNSHWHFKRIVVINRVILPPFDSHLIHHIPLKKVSRAYTVYLKL